MGREVDLRPARNRATPERQRDLQALASSRQALDGGRAVTVARLDALTGNPALVRLGPVPTPPGPRRGGAQGLGAANGGFVQQALALVQGLGSVLGLAPGQPAEFAAPPHEQRVSGGGAVVHLQQQYKGIPIFQAAQVVRFGPSGTPDEIAGPTVTVAGDVPAFPRLDAVEATRRAAGHVAVPGEDERGELDPFGQALAAQPLDLSGFQPVVTQALTEFPEKPTLLANPGGPFPDPIRASLVWFPLGDTLRLTWEVLLSLPEGRGQFRTLVDAESGEIVYCHQLMHSVAARGNIYPRSGDEARVMRTFPLPWQEYPLPVPPELEGTAPADWVEADLTAGNAVLAGLGESGPPVQGRAQARAGLTFNPGDAAGDEQKVVNIFYHCCLMHDFFYLLGFREQDGNFQRDNFAAGGAAGDPVNARAHPGEVWGTANFVTPVDGRSPTMNMGLVRATGRHTAFDASVVYHEFTHGVTKRLVGGPLNGRSLDAPQSGGMGEGWGDYFACTFTGQNVVAAWVVGRPGGIRAFPYDEHFPAHEHHFGQLGQGRYTEQGLHAIGEIWCAALLQANRELDGALGAPRGVQLTLQLVVDALKLAPANPGFLDMRDAILLALEHKRQAGQLTEPDAAAARAGLWRAFARFGMGPGARSVGATLTGCEADFGVPGEEDPPAPPQPPADGPRTVRAEAAPGLAIPDNDERGVRQVLTLAEGGTLRRLRVEVTIRHTCVGDLQVGLAAPSGRWALLHDRAGGETEDLNLVCDPDTTPALAALLGQEARGDWTLAVRDLAGKDRGTLERWSLTAEVGGAEASPPGPRPHRYGYT